MKKLNTAAICRQTCAWIASFEMAEKQCLVLCFIFELPDCVVFRTVMSLQQSRFPTVIHRAFISFNNFVSIFRCSNIENISNRFGFFCEFSRAFSSDRRIYSGRYSLKLFCVMFKIGEMKCVEIVNTDGNDRAKCSLRFAWKSPTFYAILSWISAVLGFRYQFFERDKNKNQINSNNAHTAAHWKWMKTRLSCRELQSKCNSKKIRE